MSARPKCCLAFLLQTSSRHLILTPPGIALPVNNMVFIPAPSNTMTAYSMLNPNGQFFPVHRHANHDGRPTQKSEGTGCNSRYRADVLSRARDEHLSPLPLFLDCSTRSQHLSSSTVQARRARSSTRVRVMSIDCQQDVGFYSGDLHLRQIFRFRITASRRLPNIIPLGVHSGTTGTGISFDRAALDGGMETKFLSRLAAETPLIG
jgi:hypothetical protein